MEKLRSRLSYANVVSSLCLFLVLGGGAAFAAGGLGPKTVGAAQLKSNAVTTAKIRNGAVTGSKVKVSTLPTVPFAGRAAIALSAKTAVHATSADEATRAATAITAARATNATEATHATNADTAAEAARLGGSPASAFAPAASAVRAATISANGVLLSSQGITQTNVSLVSPGASLYCIKGLNPPPTAAIAQTTYSAEEIGALALAEVNYSDCQVQIATYQKSGGSKRFPFTVIIR